MNRTPVIAKDYDAKILREVRDYYHKIKSIYDSTGYSQSYQRGWTWWSGGAHTGRMDGFINSDASAVETIRTTDDTRLFVVNPTDPRKEKMVDWHIASLKRCGYDISDLDFEVEYLKLATQWFSNVPEVNFIQYDITASSPPQTAEIVICSAILEHCSCLMPALKHLVDGAERILLLRTFLGEAEHIYSIPSPVPQWRNIHRKHYNQYSFKDVLGYIEGRGFKTQVYRDEYTDSMPQFLDGVVRTFYVVHAKK